VSDVSKVQEDNATNCTHPHMVFESRDDIVSKSIKQVIDYTKIHMENEQMTSNY
jgi:hypothetical protein